MNSYNVIGLMSGTSLDGLDIVLCRFTYENQNWIYNILNATTLLYDDYWIDSLRDCETCTGRKLIALDHEYGKHLGQQVKVFVEQHKIKADFVASHGHTIFHQPDQHVSLQLGHGAYLAAHAGLPVVCDFRTLDIALGGQGAPLVPTGDELLFPEYDFCLNLGGISNVSFSYNGQRLAFDISACNMLLNALANEAGLAYDEDGRMAASGKLHQELLEQLNAPAYFSAPYPKSLGKEWVLENSLATLQAAAIPLADKLHTSCHHIATQIKLALPVLHQRRQKILVTGGGAFNKYLVTLLQQHLGDRYLVVVPAPEVVSYKEALIFAFLGVLRWQEQPNCRRTVTGAATDSIGGAIYFR
ncbi:anhydro-N-acetylmuramic acid kinase [Pontibacter qinzhouensis]|uniref:Anhydro-N-acetylmuramic acid kinase n=1 Tax=Pontibacter qinzhouensis TaxID=2603253 RepID=A0A5C8KDS2_9BACT|nr:anhydro-N-acetylmuramic acid kinase [Pontibacter qinzhouensis]TXK52887.1 anhydro-N-acetylmuramic acid kinase [Pontibacter qinzhouensis]